MDCGTWTNPHPEMRRIALALVVALVAAACSSGAAPVIGGGGFCDEARKIVDEVDQMDTEGMEFGAIYGIMADAYGRLAAKAPSELESDLKLLADGAQRLEEAYRSGDLQSESPLTDAEQQAFEDASDRVDAYMTDECGIDSGEGGDAGSDRVDDRTGAVGADAADAPGSLGGDVNQATLTVTVGGETYTESLSGEMAVSCDLYGPLEDGSIGIYLAGDQFEASVSSNDTGVTPGTYDGLIWVFAADSDLEEQVYGLQEYDGPFVLDEAYEVSDEAWFFSGSFSLVASDEWPAASVEATFSCVGPVGF